MENSKKKILLAAIGVLLIGGGIYFFAGKGAFLKGQASRDLASEIGQQDARENLNLAQRENLLESLVEPLQPRGNENATSSDTDSDDSTSATAAATENATSSDTDSGDSTSATAAATENATSSDTDSDDSTSATAAATENATSSDTDSGDSTSATAAATENATSSDTDSGDSTSATAAATENATSSDTDSDDSTSATAAAIFDTTNFTVTAILDPQKGGTFSLINLSTGIRYGQNSTKDSYRISVDYPTYQGVETSYSYDVPLSAVICKESTCASAHTETVTIYKEPFTSDQKYTYFTVTRGELYNAVQTLGVSHGTKVDFKMQIQDPNGETHTSTSSFNQKIEDDALRIAFDLENFKLTKGTYVPATDGPFIQLDYTQTDGKTNESIKYFYKGDENSFKFFIEVCDAANAEICGNYLEIESTDVATIGGSWPIPISNLKTFADGVGFTSGTKLLFKLAVQDNVAGAIKYYAKGFYLYLLP